MRDGIGKGMGMPAVIAMAMVIAIAVLLAGLPGEARAQSPAELGNPTALTAAPGPGVGEVTLAWTPAANAAVHLVWAMRADGAGNRMQETGGDTANLVIDGLDAGRDYWFIVIANQPPATPGAMPRWSQWSNYILATALAAPPPPEPDTAAAIAAGGKHTCYLDGEGIVQCWGANGAADKGQADPPDGIFAAISAGYEHTCGIRDDGGGIECWGDNASGQSAAPAGSFAAVDAGRAHTCGIRADDVTAACWGRNEYGQTDAPDGEFTAISAGGEHSCGTTGLWSAGGTTITGSRTCRRERCSMR